MSAVRIDKPQQRVIPVDAVVFRKDVYPRIKTDTDLVQTYAQDLLVLPPIEVNQNNELIDGWHRWMGHKKAGATEIAVIVTPTEDDMALFWLAIERNATHGLQLSGNDKKDCAIRIYLATPYAERRGTREELRKRLSVSAGTLSEMLSRADKDDRDRRDRRIFAMWLANHTQDEIAEREGLSKPHINEICSEFSDLKKANKPDVARAEHLIDFEPSLYDLWKQQDRTAGPSHFGNSEVRWLDNLLYMYTAPFDIVVDPFAGSGSTIDLCKKRFRRYWVSDRKPIPERAEEIRQHDLTTGLPPLHNWRDVKLVYLDPPYWKQAEGKYSNDPTDLANMPLDEFHEVLTRTITGFAKKLKPGATIAMLMQATQWKAPDHKCIDHVAEILCAVKAKAAKLELERRFFAPYESQQYNAQMVEWAKANREVLVLMREIVIWKVPANGAKGNGQ